MRLLVRKQCVSHQCSHRPTTDLQEKQDYFSYPGLRYDRPATNRLSHGMDSVFHPVVGFYSIEVKNYLYKDTILWSLVFSLKFSRILFWNMYHAVVNFIAVNLTDGSCFTEYVRKLFSTLKKL
jgi:hypothetical protein